MSCSRSSLALLVFALALPAAAQTIEARGTVGAMIFADDGSVTEAAGGGSVRFYFSRRWSIEPQLMFARRTTSFVQDSNLIFWGNIGLDFLPRETRVTPYWFASPGVTRHTTKFGSSKFTNSEAAIGTGLGVRIRVTDRVFVSPQMRFGLADGIFAEFTGSLGFVLRK
jgi:hypothetical protein